MLLFGAEIPLVELFAVFSVTSLIILAAAVGMMLILYKQLKQAREIMEAASEATPYPTARPSAPSGRPIPGKDITFIKRAK
jgi:hypothetical protein